MQVKTHQAPELPVWNSHPKELCSWLLNLLHLSSLLQGLDASCCCCYCHPLHHAAKEVCCHHCPHDHRFLSENPFHFQVHGCWALQKDFSLAWEMAYFFSKMVTINWKTTYDIWRCYMEHARGMSHVSLESAQGENHLQFSYAFYTSGTCWLYLCILDFSQHSNHQPCTLYQYQG